MLVKNFNHLHAEISLGYLEDAKFNLESKASFIDISSIASFNLFDCLVAGILHFFGPLRGWLEVLALARIHPIGNYFLKRNRVPLSNFFSFSNMFFI